MIVSKFGGSATTTKRTILNIQKLNTDERNVFVFSAIGKTANDDAKLTDLLLSYTKKNTNKAQLKKRIKLKLQTLCNLTNVHMPINEIVDGICNKFIKDNDKAFFVSRGEFLTTKIMAKFLNIKFIPAENVIFFKNNKINYEKTEKTLKKLILNYKKIIIPGFYGTNEILNSDLKSSKIKLMSRGGSDLTACIVAKCLGANLCENWTDVDGIYEINPKICKSKLIKNMSYADLKILTSYDTKVIQKKCADVLNGSDTILHVKNIFTPTNNGTQISTMCNEKFDYAIFKKQHNFYKLLAHNKNGFDLTCTTFSNLKNNILLIYKKIKKMNILCCKT